MPYLLAVDLGIKTGLALFDGQGRLIWYRSRNFGTANRLRRAVYGLLNELPDLQYLVLEGGGTLYNLWNREARRRGLDIRQVSAEQWRTRLLKPSRQRTGTQAKRSACDLARQVIERSGTPKPTSLRHDAAEAVLIGLWAVHEIGWLTDLKWLPGNNRRDTSP
ncbi:MAG TPA: hypothetical protein PKY77_05340 [Phycisphaerae bacterium]|nr:hypothetical protein [Phycisphaerae bacterium]HRY68937.1 hypothetical protein [Phycisphaerae bacterium]HSA25764.1 hypothetical protein [Phycisphaerae bacterium]